MNVPSCLVLALLLVGTVCASATDGDVHVLTTSSFDDFVNGEDISLVEFYAPWCGHCKTLAPEYAKAATTLKSSNPPVKLAKVDATEEPDLASRFGVTGYPTIKVFRKGTPSEYAGAREYDGIVSYMRKQAAPAITIFKTLAELEAFVKDNPAIVFLGPSSGSKYKDFEQLSSAQRETFRFGKTEVKEIVDAYGKDGDIVLVHAKRYQSPLEVAKIPYSDGDLLSWINKHILPLVGEMSEDTMSHYLASELPLVKIYGDVNWALNPKHANALLNKIRKVAKDYKDKFTFAFVSKSKNAKDIDELALPKGENPFSIHHTQKNHRFPSLNLFSAESLKSHLDNYLADKLEPYIKSEPVPESQPADGPVTVVARNFDSIVNDPTKDVLIEAYAPWCGHCKTLEPKWNELAQSMKKYDSITIAKVDATANELPPHFAVKGFPTIFFVPADKKDAPVKYEGAREVADFTAYLEKHATIPLKAKKGHDEL